MHEFIEQGDRALRDSLKALVPEDPAKVRALEEMPEEVKCLYVRVLVAQCLLDGELDPREVADVYVFMSQIGLDPSSREAMRRVLADEGAGTAVLVALVGKIVSKVENDEKDVVAGSLFKDMMRVSRADGAMTPPERDGIGAVAEELGKDPEEAVQLAEKVIERDEAIVKGQMSAGEAEKAAKEIAACATAASVPITALFFSGSVAGLSAAGVTSGLAALGLGGILGLSSMVTGIGVLVVMGVGAYSIARWAMGGKERELEKQREHMIQDVLKQHQKAMSDLAGDVNGMAAKMEEYATRSDRNEADLLRLKNDLRTFRLALGALEDREQRYAAS